MGIGNREWGIRQEAGGRRQKAEDSEGRKKVARSKGIIIVYPFLNTAVPAAMRYT
ncbi:MAG: hypothetical protein F6K47_17830 [Symploca sp. SIO2E6]|nr:hypothetical protein [Symploca sp. SIO2E6]